MLLNSKCHSTFLDIYFAPKPSKKENLVWCISGHLSTKTVACSIASLKTIWTFHWFNSVVLFCHSTAQGLRPSGLQWRMSIYMWGVWAKSGPPPVEKCSITILSGWKWWEFMEMWSTITGFLRTTLSAALQASVHPVSNICCVFDLMGGESHNSNFLHRNAWFLLLSE